MIIGQNDAGMFKSWRLFSHDTLDLYVKNRIRSGRSILGFLLIYLAAVLIGVLNVSQLGRTPRPAHRARQRFEAAHIARFFQSVPSVSSRCVFSPDCRSS